MAGEVEKTKEMDFELLHIGINSENEEEAIQIATMFETLFGLKKKVGNSSIFSGTIIEVMKKPFLGKNGHIALGTANAQKAKEMLEAKGVKFNESTAKYKDGVLTVIYLQEEIGGFAVHFVQK